MQKTGEERAQSKPGAEEGAEGTRARQARRGLAWLLRLVISAAVLTYLFSVVPAGAVVAALGRADLLLVALGLLLALPSMYLGAAQQKALTDVQGMSLGLGKLVEINLASRFYGLFAPGYLAGGLYRWARMARPTGRPTEAFAAIVFNRWLETAVVLTLGLTFWLVARPPQVGAAAAAVPAVVLAGLVAGYVLLFDGRVTAGLQARLAPATSPDGGGGDQGGGARRLGGRILAASALFGRMPGRARLGVVGMCVARHLLEVLVFLLFAAAVGIRLTFPSAGWIASALQIALMLPVAWAGLGVREAGLVVMLGPFGVAAHEALAFSFLLLGRTLLTAAVGGVIEGARLLAPRGVAGR